jgi:hypothetical protein
MRLISWTRRHGSEHESQLYYYALNTTQNYCATPQFKMLMKLHQPSTSRHRQVKLSKNEMRRYSPYNWFSRLHGVVKVENGYVHFLIKFSSVHDTAEVSFTLLSQHSVMSLTRWGTWENLLFPYTLTFSVSSLSANPLIFFTFATAPTSARVDTKVVFSISRNTKLIRN